MMDNVIKIHVNVLVLEVTVKNIVDVHLIVHYCIRDVHVNLGIVLMINAHALRIGGNVILLHAPNVNVIIILLN